MSKQPNIYFQLFYKNLYISAFTFGGGYVVIPMIKKLFVDKNKLLTHDELLNLALLPSQVRERSL